MGFLNWKPFALFPAGAPNWKLYPTVSTSLPPRSLLLCRVTVEEQQGSGYRQRESCSEDKMCWSRNAVTDMREGRNPFLQRYTLSYQLITSGGRKTSWNINRCKHKKTFPFQIFKENTEMHIWIEQFVQMFGNRVSRAMELCFGFGCFFRVFVCLWSLFPRKIQPAVCPKQSGQTAIQSKECSCIPTSHISERKHPYSAFLWEHYPLVAQCFSTSRSPQVRPRHSKHWQIMWRRNCFDHHYEAIKLIWPHFEDSLSQVVCIFKADYAESHKNL